MKRDLQNPSHWVFNRVAADYDARPNYPQSLVDRLYQILTPGSVADLGAGSGLLSLPLAERGLSVFAVEPSAEMRSRIPTHKNITIIAATAEETTLPARSVQNIVAAEAAQWFQLEKTVIECRRVIQPGGVIAAIEWGPIKARHQAQLAALLQKYNPKTLGRTNQPAPRWIQQTCRQAPIQESFVCVLEWSIERFVRSIRSYSYIGPALGPERLSMMESELRAMLLDVYQSETFTEERSAQLYWGRV